MRARSASASAARGSPATASRARRSARPSPPPPRGTPGAGESTPSRAPTRASSDDRQPLAGLEAEACQPEAHVQSSSAKNGLPPDSSCRRWRTGRAGRSRAAAGAGAPPRPAERRSATRARRSAAKARSSPSGAARPRPSVGRAGARPVVPEAARREAQHGGGRRVEPLDVIDRHDHRRLLGQRPENAQGGKGDHLLGGVSPSSVSSRAVSSARRCGLGSRARASSCARIEIPERSVREARLRLSRARAESNHARAGAPLERRVPDGRLACPGLALDDHRLRAGGIASRNSTDAQ